MKKTIQLQRQIAKSDERNYLPVYFDVEDDVERIDIRYQYPRYSETAADGVTCRGDICTVDLAVMAPSEEFVGSSGSNRNHIWISPLGSAQGFASLPITKGRWEIILGAYEVPDAGALVEYEVTLTLKHRRLFKGDTHSHTLSSDGTGTIAGNVEIARQQGLDFFFVTDHNNHAQNSTIGHYEGITVLPGTEWTHYNGHSTMLGLPRAFTLRYATTNLDETKTLMQQARDRGAFVSLAHPFCSWVPWLWGFDVPYDGLEVWNGVMQERNYKAIAFWHSLLVQGRHVPITGGSDYHRPELLLTLGTPTMCLYAPSRENTDLLAALRAGHGYITYQSNGPGIDAATTAPGGKPAHLGDTVAPGTPIEFTFSALKGGDEIRLITADSSESILCEEGVTGMQLSRSYQNTPFVRAEIHRSYAAGLPPMIALVSNPVYFQDSEL